MSDQFIKSPIGNLCLQITQQLIAHPMSAIFRKPIPNTDEFRSIYYAKIKHPMDFETVKKKLKENTYQSHQEWQEDVFLIYSNAIEFNTAESVEGGIALFLKAKTEKLIKQIYLFNHQNYEEQIRILYRRMVRITNLLCGTDINCCPKYKLSELEATLNQLEETTDVEQIIRQNGESRVIKKSKDGVINLEYLSHKTLDALWLKYCNKH